jgi:hypothetical protein
MTTLLKITIIIISSASLSFIYRIGSSRVDKENPTPGIRDLGAYLEIGNQVLNGQNPYVNPNLRAGYLGSIAISLLDNLFSQRTLSFLWQILTVLSFIIFSYSISRILNLRSLPLMMILIMIWFSSVRENLVTNQITGLIALIYALIFILIKNNQNFCVLHHFTIAVLTVLAWDLKPHLTILPLLLVFVYIKRFSLIVASFTLWILSHFFFFILFDKPLFLEWLRSLIMQAGDNSPYFGDSRFVWNLLINFGIPKSLIFFTSMFLVLFASSCLVFFREKFSLNTFLILAFSIPALGIYFHFYDFSILAVLVFSIAFHYPKGNLGFTAFIATFFVTGTNFEDSLKLSLVLLVCVMSYLFFREYNYRFDVILGYAGATFLNFFLFQIVAETYILDVKTFLSWSASCFFALSRHRSELNSKRKKAAFDQGASKNL